MVVGLISMPVCIVSEDVVLMGLGRLVRCHSASVE